MTRGQRPSEDLKALGFQLRQSLKTIGEKETPDSTEFRRFLRRIISMGWRAAADCDSLRMREVIELVRDARPLIDDALPLLGPRETAAVELQHMLGALYVGEDELREMEIEARLSDQGRHPLDREILRILGEAEQPLRQGQVADLLPEEVRVTAARVGQVLRDWYDHSIVRRQMGKGPGRSEVSHYLLAPRGWALFRQLGLSPRPEPKPEPAPPRLTKQDLEDLIIGRVIRAAYSSRDARKINVAETLCNPQEHMLAARELAARGDVRLVALDG